MIQRKFVCEDQFLVKYCFIWFWITVSQNTAEIIEEIYTKIRILTKITYLIIIVIIIMTHTSDD